MRPEADQAEGLRRLLVRGQTQVVTVVAGKPGIGRTSATVNLAAALARSGKDVLLLDENHAPDGLLGRTLAGYDLLDAAQGKCRPGEAVARMEGFCVAPAARAVRALARLDPDGQRRIGDALLEMSNGIDVLLVDAAKPAPSRIEDLAGQAGGGALLVVVDATASGITESYALIKRLTLEHRRLRFGIMVNRVADERAAMTVFDNMAGVARRNLAVRLEYLGHVPHDDRLRQATRLGRPVVDAFPDAVSASSYMKLSQKLLCLPAQQSRTQGKGSVFPWSGLSRQASQPPFRHSREMAYVVN